MAETRDIAPVGAAHFGSEGGPPQLVVPPVARKRERRPHAFRDQVALTDPRRATLRLLRQRVLENTRLCLALSRPGELQFAAPERAPIDTWVGRLLSDQNMLASRRAGEWSPERVAEALEDGLDQGLMETLQILYELDELDTDAWQLVCDVQDEFHRKQAGLPPTTDRD